MRVIALALAATLYACSPTTYTRGVPNLEQVEPGLWRSGQPTTATEWAYLKSIGVRHVVKLNYDHEGTDDLARAAGLDVHVLSIHPDTLDVFAPIDAHKVYAALRVIIAGGGVLVHCTHGQDRTGLIVGLWRIAGDYWTAKRAYAEMLAHHFHPALVDLSEYWERATRGVP